ncbi:YceH family protein [Desulfopila inferna]|uniref:YceH family protein n=1 Tax=Desulfopila inferna TaxID=468528 RepID=UPI0019634D42|nr:YceH family protein [Desulfopila inferna]MBM9606410.1 YceH family protein [Desulfopila inferna]
MDILLSDTEVRVLGCLMEKERATPDYYPLSLNGLINACNQKSNRDPVVSYDEETVVSALDSLIAQKLVRQSNVSRVAKYEHIFTKGLNLVGREEAILAILLLRGPQTVGEIRGRTERLYSFTDLGEVQATISSLEESGLVTKLPRQPGRKESRYDHLLSGERKEAALDLEFQTATPTPSRENDRITELEEQVARLDRELVDLRREFMEFKSQFE